jgi:hypothetical protein
MGKMAAWRSQGKWQVKAKSTSWLHKRALLAALKPNGFFRQLQTFGSLSPLRPRTLPNASTTRRLSRTVTGKVYNHSARMLEKRAVLNGIDAELRRIIGLPAAQPKLKLVA